MQTSGYLTVCMNKLFEKKEAVPKVMSVALIEPLVEMTATLNVVVSINSTTVMQTYWTASFFV